MKWIIDFLKVLVLTFKLGPKEILRLKEEVLFDSLTGALSRKALKELGQKEAAQAKRFSHDLSLIFIDLDNFKEINDTLGHKIGDKVLKEFVSCFNLCSRGEDQVFRFGGDEFVIILPEEKKEEAEVLIQRLKKKLYSLDFEIPGDIRIEFSYGIAELDQKEDFFDLLHEADQKMYQNKKNHKLR